MVSTDKSSEIHKEQARIRAFNQILFRWHRNNYTPMPWRDTHDPYRILISELMLQQTQVDRVRTKYAEFLRAFPSVRVLAQASLGDVLRVWSGLGYNRRAKYLHEAAQRVMRDHNGKFPQTMHELRTLPGIGISTAAAVCAFAFDQEEPMIDTNTRRILSRVFFRTHVPSDTVLYDFAKAMIGKGKGRAWNYAMLDLGRTMCMARNHNFNCPLAPLHGVVTDFVYKKPQTKFHGSDRFYRGQIMKLLASGSHTVHRLALALGQPPAHVRLHIATLKRDGLVHVSHGTVALPS